MAALGQVTVPRQIGYEVAAIFEVGVYDYDQAFVVMPMEDAQTLLMMGEDHTEFHRAFVEKRTPRFTGE